MQNPILYLLHYGLHKPIGLAGAGLGRCSREGRGFFFQLIIARYEVKQIEFAVTLSMKV